MVFAGRCRRAGDDDAARSCASSRRCSSSTPTPSSASTMRWELEADGHRLRAAAQPRTSPTSDEAIDNCWLVGLHTSLARLEPASPAAGRRGTGTRFAAAQAHYAELGLAPPVDARDDAVVAPTEEGSTMTQLLRVQNFMVSEDGFGAGEGQSLERPFGHADPAELAAWAGATASWPNRTDPGGIARASTTTSPATSPTTSAPRSWVATSSGPSGARGRTTSGRAGGATRRRSTRRCSSSPTTTGPAFTLADTTFHFIDATPAEALQQAKAAADGKDVRLGGGVADRPRVPRRRPRRHHARRRGARSSSAAASASGTRPTSCSTASTSSRVPSPSGVTHHLFWRR